MRSAVGALLRKDLRAELRTLESIPAMTLFAVTTFVLFHFGLDRSSLEGDLASGVLWVTLLFAAVLGQNRLFVAEEEQGGFDGFLLAPVDRTALFVAKAIALFGFLATVELVALPAFALFFTGLTAATVAAVALADVGICTVGALLAAIAVAGRARELLLPLLFLPVALPLVVGGVGATVTDEPGRYLAFLALYDALFAVLSWATFEYVVTE